MNENEKSQTRRGNRWIIYIVIFLVPLTIGPWYVRLVCLAFVAVLAFLAVSENRH